MANEMRCTRCGVTKSAVHFTKREKRCRQCRAEIARERWAKFQADPERYALELKKRREYYQRNKARWEGKYAERRAAGWTRDPRYIRGYRLMTEYGLSLADYDAMLQAQNGVCDICGETETAKDNLGSVKPLTVDHDHASGRVRALLCNACNLMLGAARDRADLLRQAADYLERFSNE
jgi:Recombination endonuclease VII